MNSRKFRKIFGIISRTRLNADLLRFTRNLTRRAFMSRTDASRDIPYPTTLMLELTNRCNLHCVTCPREYAYGREMSQGNMSKELAFRIVDECYPYLQSIGLTGLGETLFAPHLLEVARYIKQRKKSIVIMISTNANIPGFIDKITPLLPLIDTVQISIDGIGEGYERIRHGASFSMLVENIDRVAPLARANNVDLMFNMVITKLNYMMMPDVVRFAQAHGVRYANFTYFNLASVTDIPSDYYEFFSTPEFLEVLNQTRAAAAESPDVEVTGLDFPGNPGIRKCPLTWNHFQINFDGEIPPCCAKPFSKEYSFGNVTEAGVLATLNSPAAKRLRACWVAGKPHPFCQKCHFVHL